MRAVYVSPNSIGSALVRSQVLPYLRVLERGGIETQLVTFERGEPYPEGEFPRERWSGIRARRGRGLMAKIEDLVAGLFVVGWLVLRWRADLIHARSYLPAAIAACVGAVLRRPFVFDMRGFLGDEYVEGGNWTPSDMRYRVLRRAERILFSRAAAIVVLTHRAEERLRSEPRFSSGRSSDITVIPCAVDLARFTPALVPPRIPALVYSGSLGMWYLLDEMLVVYAKARALVPDLRFIIVNLNEHALVHDAIERLHIDDSGISVRGADFGDMPGLLRDACVGISLLRQVPSKLGSSPIKIAEYLATGLPVIVNAGLGDTAGLVSRYGAGHVVATMTEDELDRAGAAVVHLVTDRQSGRNARHLAEREFDVRDGAEAYRGIYERITSRRLE